MNRKNKMFFQVYFCKQVVFFLQQVGCYKKTVGFTAVSSFY